MPGESQDTCVGGGEPKQNGAVCFALDSQTDVADAKRKWQKVGSRTANDRFRIKGETLFIMWIVSRSAPQESAVIRWW